MKIVPCDKFIRTLKGKITVLLGERRQEGERGGGSRADLFAWRPKPDLSKNGRKVVKVSPILEMRENEVWDVIEKNNLPKHPCYSWGVSRASCAVCIFSSNREIEIAAEKAPDIVEMLLEAEKKIDHTFHYSNTKKRGEEKETLADILKPYFARKEKEAA
jgi:3'-phosphoadenosine 5'-phosphosulfate sulfotransferase (PAPS reductase)/FAD synthetase